MRPCEEYTGVDSFAAGAAKTLASGWDAAEVTSTSGGASTSKLPLSAPQASRSRRSAPGSLPQAGPLLADCSA
jgi:hypothetical protein